MTVNNEFLSGTTVKLNNFPDVKWIIYNGKYRYRGQLKDGWYLKSVVNHKIVPLTEDLKNNMFVINRDANDSKYPKFGYYKDEQHKPSYDIVDTVMSTVQYELRQYVTKSELDDILKDIPNWDFF